MNRYLITGGCGFIGSHFINNLFSNHEHFEILVNIDRLDYCANINNVDKNIQNDSKYFFKNGDICNEHYIYEILLN